MSVAQAPQNANTAAKADEKVVPLAVARKRLRAHRADQEFLPAALEVLETPPSPIRIAFLGAICALAAIAFAWAYFGQIDIVAVAQGKIQPTGRVKVVQPLESGRVKTIRVENGHHVEAGDVLVELDPSEAAAEEAGLRATHAAFAAEAVRRREAIRAIETLKEHDLRPVAPPTLPFPPTTPEAIRQREARVLKADLNQLAATFNSLSAQIAQKKAERQRLNASIEAQRDLVATVQERVTMRTTLVQRAAGTKAAVIDAAENLYYQRGILATQTGQLAEAEAGLQVLAREISKSRDVFVAENAQKLAEAERQVDDLVQKIAKAEVRTRNMTLRAPITGTVQASSVTTIGQVVMPSEELMRIVPDGSTLEIEAYLQNKDVGFVRPGEEVTIKIESFPFTRYGTIPGTVLRIATDAIPEPDAQQIEGNPAKSSKSGGFTGGAQRTQNLVFPIAVRPDATSILADGAIVPLSPGMAVTIEAKTGRRRILEYLFSPLVEVASQAMRER